MNNYTSKFIAIAMGLQMFFACTPGEENYRDNRIMDLSRVDSIALVPNHVMVLADGYAQLELFPRLYTKEGNLIPDDRVQDEWLEYVSESGISLSRHFSISDASLIGQEITAWLKIKGTDIESERVTFRIASPLEKEYTSEMKIPVVFHIIQTTEDIESFGGKYRKEQIDMLLKKLNNMFDGSTTHNPVGVDTHIRLEPALYGPYGDKLVEPGINRLSVKEITTDNAYQDFLESKHLVWSAEHYLNIWLVSDRTEAMEDFGLNVSDSCRPYYVHPGVTAIPEGLELKEYTGETLKAKDVGIIYKLQELDNIDRDFSIENNELGYYIGRFLGLFPTCNWIEEEGYTDYCNDTHKYSEDSDAIGDNETWYKEANGCYFRAENIMDDPRGGHCSISREQCIRMRWVLEHCPGRGFWKSDAAFTGKTNDGSKN